MTTMDVPGFRDYAVMRLASMARKRAQSRSQINANALQVIIRVVLHLAGFALLTLGAFTFSMIAGYIVAGISCFVFSSLMAVPETKQADPAMRG